MKATPKQSDLVKVESGQHLALARITKVSQAEYGLRMRKLRTPEVHDGKCYRYVFEFGGFDKSDSLVALVARGLVNERSDKAARLVFHRLKAFYEREAQRMGILAKVLKETPQTQQEYDAQQAQWQVLSEVFPDTIKNLKAGQVAAPAFKAETLRQTHVCIDGEIDEATERCLEKALRRKRKWFDPVDYELALNWTRKNYYDMTRTALSAAIHTATGRTFKPDAIAKRAARLGLFTSRSPGPQSRV